MTILTLGSLNVGRLLEARTREFLESLAQPGADVPDVLCIQDMPLDAVGLFQRHPYHAFCPMTNHLINGERGVVGIGIFSRYFMTDVRCYTTFGDGTLKDLQGINERNERFPPTEETDRLIEATEDRVAVFAAILKEGVRFDAGTTHGMWVRGGKVNNVQRISNLKLLEAIETEIARREGFVFEADMNAVRGGEMHALLTGTMRDWLPLSVESTLDPDHPLTKRGINVVVDYVMTAPRRSGYHSYEVDNVRLRSGISDHCMLLCDVTKKEI